MGIAFLPKSFLLRILLLLSLVFLLNNPAFSISCGKSIDWQTFNHPKLELGKYNKLTQNEESVIIKVKGYVYYINRNHYKFITDCTPKHIVRPIFFNDKYQYIELSDSGMKGLDIEDKIRDCIEKHVQFNKPNKITLQRVEDSEISEKHEVSKIEGDDVEKFLNSENLFIHPQNIKTCKAVIEGRVVGLATYVPAGMPQMDISTEIFHVSSIQSMNRVE